MDGRVLVRPHLDGLSDVIEHCAASIVIGVTHPNPRMSEIARTDGRCRRSFGWKVRSKNPRVVFGEHLFTSAVSCDMAVLTGSQRDQSSGKAAAWLWGGLAEHQSAGPFGVEVKVIGVVVEIPQAASGGTSADLAESEALVADKPFHVSGGGSELKEIDHALAKLAKGLITRGVDAVGEDDLRADPAGAHGFEDVGIIVTDAVKDHLAVAGQGVIKAFVAFDEFFHGKEGVLAVGKTRFCEGLFELFGVVDTIGGVCARAIARFEDDGIARFFNKQPCFFGVIDGSVARTGDASCTQELFHLKFVAAEVDGFRRYPGDLGAFADTSSKQHMAFDGGLEAIDPRPTVLDTAYGLVDSFFIADRRDLFVSVEPSFDLVIEMRERCFADA